MIRSIAIVRMIRWHSPSARGSLFVRSIEEYVKIAIAAIMGESTIMSQTINLIEGAQAKMRSLSLAQQQTVVDFIDFLATKQFVVSRDEEKLKQQRIPDLDRSNYRMSDDFNDPLPDEFWLGDES
jgi:hypothetical protein